MTPTPSNQPAASEPLSPNSLSQAYAQALASSAPTSSDPNIAASDSTDDDTPVLPDGILEALLFVGRPDNSPISPDDAAAVMPDVSPEGIPDIVSRLNEKYAEAGNAFEIVFDDGGYRLKLREEYARLRDAFHGRVKEVTLSQAAVDVLALVAYRQPISLEDINTLRTIPSGGIVRQLVRRRLIRFEADADNPRIKLYSTTRRVLNLLGLESLDDLPQSDDA